jgi:hypothetical protein
MNMRQLPAISQRQVLGLQLQHADSRGTRGPPALALGLAAILLRWRSRRQLPPRRPVVQGLQLVPTARSYRQRSPFLMSRCDISVRSRSFGLVHCSLGILLALGACADGGDAPSPKDAASGADMEVGPDGKGGAAFVPVDEESCRKATLVSSCMPSPALATIRSAAGQARSGKRAVHGRGLRRGM